MIAEEDITFVSLFFHPFHLIPKVCSNILSGMESIENEEKKQDV